MASYQSVLNDALTLPEDEREMLVIEIGLSLDGATESWLPDDQFLGEILRRSQEAREHPELLVPWETVRAELFGDTTER